MPSNLQPVRLRLLGFIALSVVGTFSCAPRHPSASPAQGAAPSSGDDRASQRHGSRNRRVISTAASYYWPSRSTGAIPPRRYRPVLSRPAVCNRNRICRQ